MKIYKSKLSVAAVVAALALTPALADVVAGFASGTSTAPAVAVAPAAVSADTMRLPLDSIIASANPFDSLYLDAVCQLNAGNDSLARVLIERAIALNPNAAEAYFLRSRLGNVSDSAAFADMRRAAALQPGNSTYQESVAETYITRKDYASAISAYEAFYSRHRDRSDILRTLVGLYVATRDYDRAIETVGRMEKVDGESEDLMFLRMQLYDQRGDTKNSYRTLVSVVEAHPYEPNYKVMLGNWLMQHGRKDEAFARFNDALKLDPQNAFTLNSLYDYYNSVGDQMSAGRLRDQILLSPQTDAQTRSKMLVNFINSSEKQHSADSVAVLELINRTMAAAPRDADVSNIKAVYMRLKQMPADSVDAAYRHTLSFAPDNAEARFSLIQDYWKKNDWKNVEQLSREGTQYNPDDLTFYYALGMACMQTGRDDEALRAFRRGLDEVNYKSDQNIVSDMYALSGDILYGKGQPDQAFASYDSCLQWKDDNMGALNNYAYYLSEQKRDLKRAERMSLKTIEAEPTNPTYLDTYAWILCLEQRYDEAKAYIDRALENDSDSLPSHVIVEHAGDIYCLSGDTARAVELWQKAIDCGGDKAVLSRKIKTKKVEN